MAQAEGLVDRGVVVEREGRRQGSGEVVETADGDLDLAGREGGVDVLGAAADDLAGDADDVLGAELVGGGVGFGSGVGMEDELDETGAVAEVDEDDAAVVAAGVDPAGEA